MPRTGPNDTGRDLIATVRGAVFRGRADLALVAGLTLLAGLLRLWDLGAVPAGLHGDEAWTGLDAQRVLREGWIGPYVLSALGQPTGPLYFTAALFSFLPDTTLTLRLSMALFGVATVPVAYLAFRSMFDATVATFAALLLAVMTWHLHLSRTGFMVTSWPFMEMLVLWVLWLALQRRSLPLFAVAGALGGLGVYSYNAYPLFLLVVVIAFAWSFARARGAPVRRRLTMGAVIFATAAAGVAAPLIAYAIDNADTYRLHQERVGVMYSEAWEEAGAFGRAEILADRAWEYARALAYGDRPDFGDGLAEEGQPVVDTVTLSLAVAGLSMAFWRWRRPEYAVVIAAVAVLPLGALLTEGDGLFRRTFGLAPFIAVLAAFPLAWIWRRIVERGDAVAYTMGGLLLACLVFIGGRNAYEYFGPLQDTVAMNYVYPRELDAAARRIATFPKDTRVYFYSDRWGFDYETRIFLAPGYEGADRSREFRSGSLRAPLDFSAGRDRPALFVFLGDYLDEAERATQRHPGGTLTEGTDDGEVIFRTYYLPAE